MDFTPIVTALAGVIALYFVNKLKGEIEGDKQELQASGVIIAHYPSLITQVNTQQGQLDKLREQVMILEGKVFGLEKEIARLTAELQAKDEIIEVGSAQIVAQNAEIVELKRQLDERTKERDLARAELEVLRKQVNERKA